MSCANFAVSANKNKHAYIENSTRFGYVATACQLCGSNSPRVDNQLITALLAEKIELHFGRKVVGCRKCQPHFFDGVQLATRQYGFTSSGTVRKRCIQCQHVFTAANYKNKIALHAVLASVIANVDAGEAVKSTGLSSRLYYFYLNQLAEIFSSFCRLNEQQKLYKQRLVMHTIGHVVNFKHQRRAYVLITAEASSGYILLQSSNLTQVALAPEQAYSALKDTRITDNLNLNLYQLIESHYQQNMNRQHFEELLIGKLNNITKCQQIYPSSVAYVHFQLLKVFTQKAEQYAHYIKYESCLRSAALMAVAADAKKGNAEVYYFQPFENGTALDKLTGQKLGWWGDRWFSNKFGAYCSITTPQNTRGDLRLSERNSVNTFYDYLSKNMNKRLNSMTVIENLFEIHRVLFNFCEKKNGISRAQALGLLDKTLSPAALLDEALQKLSI